MVIKLSVLLINVRQPLKITCLFFSTSNALWSVFSLLLKETHPRYSFINYTLVLLSRLALSDLDTRASSPFFTLAPLVVFLRPYAPPSPPCFSLLPS